MTISTRFFRLLQKSYRKFVASKFSSIQIIVTYYVILTLIALLLFTLPIFRQPDSDVPLIDLVFMAISTVSVTGLSTFDIHSVFNQYGVILLEVLFQVGGFGIMMISTFFFILSKRKITLRQRQLIMTDMNQPRLSGVVRLIKRTLIILISLQIIFGVAFGTYFYLHNDFETVRESLFWGIFQSVSAVTNSGFDVTGESLLPFAQHNGFLLWIMILMFIGSIGFPVLLETTDFVSYQFQKKRLPYRFSLFTKLAVSSFLVLFIVGGIVIYNFENNHLYQFMGTPEKVLNAFFYSMSTRNAGLQINHLSDFQPNTLLFMSVLMFIGASPSSVGGGIRTTTVAIVFLYLIAFLKGETNVNLFGRRIDQSDIQKSVVVLNLSLIFCFAAVLILMATQPSLSMISIVVEVASAFGTTGLSLGITDQLDTIGKITIALLMFIGRVGTLYILMLFVPKQTRDLGYEYPSEKIIIG
ncbi:MAG: TrkH family potassium uptake protein [Streptococcaceae bacterium]|jgi:Trk-type K+ transport system membrane component|nr:TrkH family potassium uptake protein [Streptococcaceae bacterium]MCH4177706.1 TrkH family potassium uptake protein [Streptococcaceae bacterium]